MKAENDKSKVELVDCISSRPSRSAQSWLHNARSSDIINKQQLVPTKREEPFHVFLLLLILGDIFHHDGTNSSSHFHLGFSKRAAHLDDDDADDDAAVRRACAQLTAGRHGPSVAMTTRSAAPSVHINRHATCALPSLYSLSIFHQHYSSIYLYLYILQRDLFVIGQDTMSERLGSAGGPLRNENGARALIFSSSQLLLCEGDETKRACHECIIKRANFSFSSPLTSSWMPATTEKIASGRIICFQEAVTFQVDRFVICFYTCNPPFSSSLGKICCSLCRRNNFFTNVPAQQLDAGAPKVDDPLAGSGCTGHQWKFDYHISLFRFRRGCTFDTEAYVSSGDKAGKLSDELIKLSPFLLSVELLRMIKSLEAKGEGHPFSLGIAYSLLWMLGHRRSTMCIIHKKVNNWIDEALFVLLTINPHLVLLCEKYAVVFWETIKENW